MITRLCSRHGNSFTYHDVQKSDVCGWGLVWMECANVCIKMLIFSNVCVLMLFHWNIICTSFRHQNPQQATHTESHRKIIKACTAKSHSNDKFPVFYAFIPFPFPVPVPVPYTLYTHSSHSRSHSQSHSFNSLFNFVVCAVIMPLTMNFGHSVWSSWYWYFFMCGLVLCHPSLQYHKSNLLICNNIINLYEYEFVWCAKKASQYMCTDGHWNIITSTYKMHIVYWFVCACACGYKYATNQIKSMDNTRKWG